MSVWNEHTKSHVSKKPRLSTRPSSSCNQQQQQPHQSRTEPKRTRGKATKEGALVWLASTLPRPGTEVRADNAPILCRVEEKKRPFGGEFLSPCGRKPPTRLFPDRLNVGYLDLEPVGGAAYRDLWPHASFKSVMHVHVTPFERGFGCLTAASYTASGAESTCAQLVAGLAPLDPNAAHRKQASTLGVREWMHSLVN
jgi:hypothetical protein